MPAFAATFTVTDTADSGPNTLREAIAAANSAAGADTIEFQLGALPATITLLTGQLVITENLTITGPGAGNLTINGNNASRVFFVNSGVTADISGLTITGGNGTGSANGNGGGIFIDNVGTLRLTDSTVYGNTAGFYGGGIYVDGAASLTLTNSTVSGNTTPFYAGGIFINTASTVTLLNSAVSGNRTTYFGGGILSQGVLTVTSSTLSGNRSTFFGGGIQSYGSLTLTNSTVSGNTANNSGGGIQNHGALTLTNSTLSGNSANVGGGINNAGSSLAMKNTIVAKGVTGPNCAGGGTSHGHNLSDDNSCAYLIALGDLNNPAGGAGLDPAGLKNNGGPTETIALVAGSPAMDAIPTSGPNYCTAVDGTTVIATDQRGMPRPYPVGGNCDMGAFEFHPENNDPGDPTNEPPIITMINGPLSGVRVGESAQISARFTDADASDTHTCAVLWGDAQSDAGALTEPSGSEEGLCQAGHAYAQPGIYTVEVTVTDDSDASDTEAFRYVAVYDPSAGFVTGGGWIQSPAGAVTSDPLVAGKANFGFTAKYQSRATTPSGQTQFQFEAGNWTFHSSSYHWLVVAGGRAQLLGAGTVNGAGNYGFLLTATDGALNGGGADKLRMKIWDMDNGNAIVYDTQQGAPDSDAPTTPLGGGSIVIHTR